MDAVAVSTSYEASLEIGFVTTPLAGVGPARAAFPGANGKIAFASSRDGDLEIFVMNPDGKAQSQLTDNTAIDTNPAWAS